MIKRFYRNLPFKRGLDIVRLSLKSLTIKPPENIEPHSKEGVEALEYYFQLKEMIDGQIKVYSNQYYDGKHPKHYLWIEHNRYIYDNIREGDKVLDIGCGASQYTQWLAEKAQSVVGVDILPERVEKSRKMNTKANVSYEVMDVTKDLPADTFDIAVCSHVIEHLDDPVAVLRAIAEKIPRIIVKVPLEDTFWMKSVKKDIGMYYFDDTDHRREYTMNLLKEQLEDAGWEITDLTRGYDARAVAKSSLLKNKER